MPDDTPPPASTRMFQITEDDLATLEQDLPLIADSAQCPRSDCSNETKTRIRRVQSILTRVRWNYLPYDEVIDVPA